MKKLAVVTMLTIVPLASGCCRAWPRWMHRGDSCNTCASGEVYGGGYETSGGYTGAYMGGYETSPVYEGTILPAPSLPSTLPGPADVPAG